MAERRSVLFISVFLVLTVIINVISVEAAVCDTVGRFGWKCRFTCHCAGGADCDKITGHCRTGCTDGRYGIGCQYLDNYVYGEKKGRAYAGKYGRPSNHVTETCLSWRDPRLESFHYQAEHFPDDDVPGPYCRNPRDPETWAHAMVPWCFVASGETQTFKYCEGLKTKECPDGTYGDLCDRTCHCLDDTEVCNKDSGYCSASKRCAAGWRGISCQFTCPQNKFGLDCKQECGKCLYNSCDPETGQCLKGCSPGYHGDFCQQNCHSGAYGINCVETCGQCRYGDCNPANGNCLGGCRNGYTGNTCLERCLNGYYGYNCLDRCPYCYNRGPCHAESGLCEKGCSPGFMGDHCDQECLNGFYGANCSQKCGHCHVGHFCDKYMGYCISGCAVGYAGEECKAAASQLNEAGSAVGGALAGVLSVVILSVIIIAFLIYRKRRFRKTLVVSTTLDSYKMEPTCTSETTLENIQETDLLLQERKPTEEDNPATDVTSDFAATINASYGQTREEPIYVNVSLKKLTNPIKVEDLQEFVLKAKENEFDLMKKEHADLPPGLLALCHRALKPENKAKNRYADIIAYDHSRVVLTPSQHDPHSDYVNANYMDGYNKPKAYMASQGPNKAMLVDFWRLIWQYKITKIVMLTNLVETCKKKCEQYWPTEESATYGDVVVETLDVAEYTDYTIRTFKISVAKVDRIIKQFHFTSWTDHGAPTYPTPLLNFRRKVQQYNPDSQGPILVHCSAGIGRTGTYISVDYLLQQARAEGLVDLLQYAQLMRSNRVNMIQTWQQYSFVYDALVEALISGETTVPNSSFPETYDDLCNEDPEQPTSKLETQFQVLKSLSPHIERDECKAALDNENLCKSRFRNILPANRFRPHLYTPVDGYNDFINAVFLPSYTQRDAFIVTQMPLPNTVADFWRLLYDYHSDTVVMLNEFDRNDKSCALYWPEEYGYTVEYGPLSIELLFSSEADTNITVRTFKLTNNLKGEDRAVKQFQFNAWPDYKSVPAGTTSLLRLTDAVHEWTKPKAKGPITVHCMNGASKSGLFCACSLVFERMRVDYEVDVFQTVKQLRINRPQFVENSEQYQFVYQMALSYLDRQPMNKDRQTDRQTVDLLDNQPMNMDNHSENWMVDLLDGQPMNKDRQTDRQTVDLLDSQPMNMDNHSENWTVDLLDGQPMNTDIQPEKLVVDLPDGQPMNKDGQTEKLMVDLLDGQPANMDNQPDTFVGDLLDLRPPNMALSPDPGDFETATLLDPRP